MPTGTIKFKETFSVGDFPETEGVNQGALKKVEILEYEEKPQVTDNADQEEIFCSTLFLSPVHKQGSCISNQSREND